MMKTMKQDAFLIYLLLNGLFTYCEPKSSKKSKVKKSDAWNEYEISCPTEESRWITQIFVGWSAPYRAHKMIPPELEVRRSTIPGAGLGVFAATFIPKYTWLGEYEGEGLLAEWASPYIFLTSRAGKTLTMIDGIHPETSSWTRWMNTPRNHHEENVDTMHCKGKVFFMTNRDIVPGTELMYYYGDEYSYGIGIIYRGWLKDMEDRMLAKKTGNLEINFNI